VKIEEVTMDRALATKLLEGNTGNRALVQRRVAAMAADMANGRWLGDGSPYRVTRAGRLIDGQHRCAAVVRADVAIPAVLVTVDDDAVQLVLDTGKPRSLADQLMIQGYTNQVVTAAVVGLLWRWENGAINHSGDWKTRPAATISELWELFISRADDIKNAIAGTRGSDKLVFMSRSVKAVCYLIFSEIDSADADGFFAELAQQRERSSPVVILTRTMNQREGQSHRGTPDQELALAYMIKAWNAYREGREISLLRWTRGGANREKFPVPV
jgi:hypothetical protein